MAINKQESHRKNKTLEQEYGIERANEIHKKLSEGQKKRWKNPQFRNHLIDKLKKRKVYWGEKISLATKGKKNPFYGKHHTMETKMKLEKNIYSKIRNKTYKEIYGDKKALEIIEQKKLSRKFSEINLIKEKEKAKKISETKKRLISEGKLNPRKGERKHSFPERILKEIIEKNNLPFNYTGNGMIWFKGTTQSFNPDFLSKNPKHIIEVFGDYWHNLPESKSRDRERLETYSRYGYKTLIIWEHELVPRWKKNLTKEQIINKINGFLNGNE